MKGGGVTGNFFRFLADAYETDDRKRKLELDEDYIKYKKMQMEKNIEEGEANEKLYQDEIKENEEEARRENSEIAIIDAEDSVENEEEDDSYNVLQEKQENIEENTTQENTENTTQETTENTQESTQEPATQEG